MNFEQLQTEIIQTFKPFNPQKIILFGSLAREDFDEDSDVDLIIVYHTDKRFLDRLKELYLKWDITRAVDILAYTPDEFEKMVGENYFVQDAVREGRIIYEST